MSYQVLARRFRPLTFDEIVGQQHVTTTLTNALTRNRVAHAYLFTGPRGCGKTTMARLMAKALNCDEGMSPSPCGKCESCTGIANGTFLDVLEIDAASNTGVDNIRELRENAQYQPSAGKKRVFIIDEVHMLSKGAFNALLKTLEEPPEHVHFIFATTEPARIPRTILSRCQRFDFRLFTLEELAARLREITTAEQIEISDAAIELLASLAEGSMRDALSLLDQAVASTEGALEPEGILNLFGLVGHEPYLELNEAILRRDPKKALDLVDDLVRGGHDLVEFARGLVANFRDLMLLKIDPALSDRLEKPQQVKQHLAAQAERWNLQDLSYLTQRSADAYAALERAPQARSLFEAQVVEYATMDERVALSDVLARLEALQGGSALPPPARGRSAGASAVVSAGRATQSPAQSPTQRPSQSPTAAAPAAAPSSPPVAPAAGGGSVATPAPEVEAALAGERGPEDRWQQFVATVKERNIAIGSCLVEAAPRLFDDTLQLVFRPENEFHQTQMKLPPNLALLTEVAREVYGRALEVQPVMQDQSVDERDLARRVQAEVVPDHQQHLAARAQENPNLGRLLDSLGEAPGES